MTELDLREELTRRLDQVEVPAPPLEPVVLAGRRRRRRRRVLAGTSTVVALAGVATWGAAVVGPTGEDGHVDDTSYAAVGALDFSNGARAYADPGKELHLAGRTFPYGELSYLDTDAVATSSGVVFFAAGRPMMLGADGEVHALVAGPVDDAEDFHPTAKADSAHPWVAYATRRGETTTLTVRDLSTEHDVASTTVGCGPCRGLVVDAFDDGVAFVRIDGSTRTWDSATGAWTDFAGPGTRVADVRNHVVLYTGDRPAGYPPGYRGPERWTLVQGAVDAQLTFDGRYVLDWSSRLRSTDGSPDLVLDQGPTGERGGPAFWAVDSDGSVLVARLDGSYPHYLVYDCEVPSGTCEELGPLVPRSGDPEFVGVDM